MSERRFAFVCNVLRDATGDFTNGGASARATRVMVIGQDGPPEGWSPPTDMPVMQVIERNLGRRLYFHVEPLAPSVPAKTLVGPMFGGNFVHSSDSRWRELFDYPLAIHDRFETVEAARELSR